MKYLLLFCLFLSSNVFAHGDHSAPGAIPPALNGGVLSEAKHFHSHSHNHNHKTAKEREIFFEAKFKNKELLVYPLELDSKTNKFFKNLKASDFTNLSIDVKDPRKKVGVKFKLETRATHWVLKLAKTRARRLMIGVSVNLIGATYKAHIQVERK